MTHVSLNWGWDSQPLVTTYWRRKLWTSLFASVTYIGAEVVHINTRTNLDFNLTVSVLTTAVLAALFVQAAVSDCIVCISHLKSWLFCRVFIAASKHG